LKLLKRLRTVFLQDSVLLRRQFPQHAIWADPLFATPGYAEFAERVLVGLNDGEEPHLTQIERANPLVANELQILGLTVASAEASIRLEITRQQRSITATLEELRGQREFVESLGRGLNRRLYINDWSHKRIQEAESQLRAAGLALPAMAGSDLDRQGTVALPEPLSRALEAVEPPVYTMVRTHGTVTDLWQEWSGGWAGRPSVQFLDDTWGHRWRRGNEVSFYSRRRLIVGEIRRLARQGGGQSLAAAAEELETRRRQDGLSLTGLNELLRRLKLIIITKATDDQPGCLDHDANERVYGMQY
jgi:hypothetical protein